MIPPDLITQLYQTEATSVFRFILGMVDGDVALAENLTHDVFVKAHEHIDQLRNADSARSWLFAIASNTVRQHWRRRRSGIESPWTVACEHRSSDDGTETLDFDIVMALVTLSHDDREIILLKGLLELKAKEIAEVLDITADAVHKRWQRARQRFSEVWEAANGPESRDSHHPLHHERANASSEVPE